MHTFLSKFLLATLLISNGAAYQVPVGSIAPVSEANSGNFCTAFSINEEEGYWATAAHCIADNADLMVGGEPAQIILNDDITDLAVLQSSRATALAVEAELPAVGTKIYKWGYGNGWSIGWDSNGTLPGFIIANPFFGHLVLVFDMIVQPGDSGSPVMTYDNKVVSVAELIFTGATKEWLNLKGVKEPSGGIDTPTLYVTLCPFLPGHVVCPQPSQVEDEQGDTVPSSSN